MKLKGSFVVREVVGQWIAVPVGETALRFGGMIVLNPVSRVIWQALQTDTDIQAVISLVTDRFDVTAEDAQKDVASFIQQMKNEDLIID